MSNLEQILIVGRDTKERDALCRRLDGAGYAYGLASTNQEALEALAQRTYCLALLEFAPPDYEGLDLLLELRKSHGILQLPVLANSLDHSTELIVRAHDLGTNDFLCQPLDSQILLAKIRRHLTTRRSISLTPKLEVGSQLGHFELLDILGEGGMGRVYRARNLLNNQLVALKVLLHARQQCGQLERFETEARAITLVSHPNVVRVHEIGEAPLPYISMELVEGVELGDPRFEGALPSRRAAEICLQILAAVGAIHAQRIIHRDLKPANVMITGDGTVKVMDFGVAKLLGTGMTDTGLCVGTPRYMSPEQIDTSFGAVTARSDLFAVAGILYRLLTGSDPFPAAGPAQQFYAITSKEPTPPSLLNPLIPNDLESICMLGLLKQPSLRFQSAGEFAAALRDHLKPRQQDFAMADSAVYLNGSGHLMTNYR